MASVRQFSIISKFDWQDLPGKNPCCKLVIVLLLHTNDIKSSFMIDSIILQMIHVKLIGLQLLAKHFSSFLYEGVIITSFQSCGSFCCLNDSVYKIDKGNDKLTERSFKILGSKLSAPGDLQGFRLNNFFLTLSSEKTTSLIFASQTGSKSGGVFFSFVNTLLKKELNKVDLPSSDVIILLPSLRSGIELPYLSLLFAYAKKASGLFFTSLDKECYNRTQLYNMLSLANFCI